MIHSAEPILFVQDPGRSRDFYRQVLACEPCLDVPGMVEFPLSGESRLGLMARAGATRLLSLEVGHGAPAGELYLYVDDPEAYLDRAVKAGGRIVSALSPRDWGDRAGYFFDPDGHLLAFACRL
jgi:catechol 2,3-dioxygenase-like lactoylglutathione lyase family enzyme